MRSAMAIPKNLNIKPYMFPLYFELAVSIVKNGAILLTFVLVLTNNKSDDGEMQRLIQSAISARKRLIIPTFQ